MAIARQFPWQRYQTFADVGTAAGGLPVQLALAHPHLTGTGFDLPPVRPVFEDYVAGFGLADRIGDRGGDFFADPMPRADVIVMGHVLHDWNLEQHRQSRHRTRRSHGDAAPLRPGACGRGSQ